MEPSTLDSALVAEVEEDTPISTSQVESAPDKSIVDTEDLQDPTKRLVSSVDGKPCIHADESSGRHSNASRSHQPSPALIKPSAEDRLPPPTNISSHPSTPTSPTHLPTAPIPLYRRRKYKPLPDPIDLPNRTSITDSNDSTTKPESGFMADISNMSTSVSSIHDDDDATDLDDDEFGTSSASVVIRDLPSVGSLTENGQLNDGKGLVFENLLLSSGDEVDGESEGGSKEERRVDEELGPSEDEDDEEDDVFFKKGVVEVPADRRSVRSFLTWTPAMGVVVVERDVDEGDEHGDGADEADIEEEDDVGGEDDAIISGGTPAPLSSSVASLGSQKVKMDVGKFPVMPSSDEVPSTRYENMITHVEGLETGKSIGSRAGSVRSEVGSHQRRRKSVSSWGKTGGRRELILEPVGVGSGTRVRGGTVAKLVERLWSPEVIGEFPFCFRL
ncbi:hypothetical protein BC829DRAFT_33360 [Chytridium lagenaria]|nr:hypothetical protein BC829DRAFT_33360 [Chytridium lagenaria]